MNQFLLDHLGDIANSIAIVLPIIGGIAWSHRKLHKDIQELRVDIRGAHSRIDAMGTRIDAMGTRIDNLYHVMMTMLQKNSSE